MTSSASSSSRTEIPFRQLPWLIAIAFLVLYVATTGRGAGIAGLPVISTVTGWDWQPQLVFPLYYVVTLPVRLLPVAMQPPALNALSALLAAGTLALVARSVQLLPQDRTRDQRERERGSHFLLSGSSAWLPPSAAALLCGLQLLFWQNATNASAEMLNLLVLAWVVRELLEYRLDGRERRLVILAFVYGLGVTNDAALIGLFPFVLGALIWIMGPSFFRSPLLLKLALAGIAGLLLYLLLPAMAVSSGKLHLTFWDALGQNLRSQKAVLNFGFNDKRLYPLVMSLGSLVPLILIGIRWPANFGDTSAAGGLLTRLMFRVLTLLYISGSLAMNFDLAHARKAHEETGLSFYSLYLLSAIVLGYSLGYLLVIFGKQPPKSWQKPGPLGLLINRAMVGLAWLILPFVGIGLFWQNHSKVHDLNHSVLYDYAAKVADDLPNQPSIVLSDDVILLSLVNDQLNRRGRTDDWLLYTRLLSEPGYHRTLHRRTGGQWPTVPEENLYEERVVDPYILKTVTTSATNRPLVYLHPSFGYYFELFYPEENKFTYTLKRYTNDVVRPPLPAAPDLEAHERFEQDWWTGTLSTLSAKVQDGRASAADTYLGQIESRALNAWGSRLQQAGRFADAAVWFERAVNLFSNNVCARINLEFNRHRSSGDTNAFALSDPTVSLWKAYRDNIQLALSLGGPLDEPGFCIGLGNLFAGNQLPRQAAQQFLQALMLTPDNQYARAQLARTFLLAQAPDRALEVLKEIRQHGDYAGLNDYAKVDLSLMEASAWMEKGKTDETRSILGGLTESHPSNPAVFEAVSRIYLSGASRQPEYLELAESTAKKLLELSPTNLVAHLQLGTAAMLKNDWSGADAQFSEVLAKDPEMTSALLNRAIANLHAGQFARALDDYRRLEEKDPDAYRVQYGLGEIAEKQGRSADALKHFKKYLERAPRVSAEYTNVVSRVAALEGK